MEGVSPLRSLVVRVAALLVLLPSWQDCTTLVQLMKRRCGRILLVLAANDLHDDFEVLRNVMDCAIV